MSDSDRYRTSARRVSSSLIPASSTNSERSGLYMSGVGRPTSRSTSSIPFSFNVASRARGGKTNPLQAAAEHFAELVLGCDRGYPHARIRKRRQNRARGDERGIGDHHLPAGGFVEIVIARDAMHLRGRPGDN